MAIDAVLSAVSGDAVIDTTAYAPFCELTVLVTTQGHFVREPNLDGESIFAAGYLEIGFALTTFDGSALDPSIQGNYWIGKRLFIDDVHRWFDRVAFPWIGGQDKLRYHFSAGTIASIWLTH